MPGAVAEGDALLAKIEDVVIDDSGDFKYILCKVFPTSNKSNVKMIIRGNKQAEFHANIFDELDAQLDDQGVTCVCTGGGRITHDPVRKTISVYGISMGYGKADHAAAVEILKNHFTDYDISFSDFD